jgi:ABC-2 type transport system permease protein
VTSTLPAAARPSLRLAIASLLRADAIVLARNRRGLLLSLAAPLILLFATSGKAAARLGGPLYLIGLAITFGLASTSIIGYAVTTARDRDQGVFQRLRLTPAPAWTILASRLAVQVAANFLVAVILLIIGAQLHHLSVSAGDYGLVLAVSMAGCAVFLAIGQALVGLVRSADTVNAASRFLLIALIFLGLFAQSGALGAIWEQVARWSPAGAVMTLFAGALNPSAWDSHDTLALAACAGYIIVFAVIGIRWFRWNPR